MKKNILITLLVGVVSLFLMGCPRPLGTSGGGDNDAPDGAVQMTVYLNPNSNVDGFEVYEMSDGVNTVVYPFFQDGDSVSYLLGDGLLAVNFPNSGNVGTSVASGSPISVGNAEYVFFIHRNDGVASTNWIDAKKSVYQVSVNKEKFGAYKRLTPYDEDIATNLQFLRLKLIGDTAFKPYLPTGSTMRFTFANDKAFANFPLSTTGTAYTSGSVTLTNGYKYVLFSLWSRGSDTSDDSLAELGYFSLTGTSGTSVPYLELGGNRYYSGNTLPALADGTLVVVKSPVTNSTVKVYARPAYNGSVVTPNDSDYAAQGIDSYTVTVSFGGTSLYSISARVQESGKSDGDPVHWNIVKLGSTPTTGVSVALSQYSASVPVGGSLTLQATISGNSNQFATWSSSNPAVATVSNTGVVTPVSAGSVTITATSVADPTKSASCSLTVTSGSNPVTSTYTFSVSYTPAGTRPLYIFKLQNQAYTSGRSKDVYNGTNPGGSIQLEAGWYSVGAGSAEVGWLSGGAFTMSIGTLTSPAISQFQQDYNGHAQWFITVKSDGTLAQGLVPLN